MRTRRSFLALLLGALGLSTIGCSAESPSSSAPVTPPPVPDTRGPYCHGCSHSWREHYRDGCHHPGCHCRLLRWKDGRAIVAIAGQDIWGGDYVWLRPDGVAFRSTPAAYDGLAVFGAKMDDRVLIRRT